jgi:hypothetical protein
MLTSAHIINQLTYLRVRGIFGYFHDASIRYDIPIALLLAIASRESNMGLNLDANWTGDYGNGIGIMQIDKRYHPDFTSSHANNDHRANIDYGAQYLAGLIRQFNGELKPAIASYNAGASRVRSVVNAGLNPDVVTTGQDYASDVLHRMETVEAVMGISKAQSLTTVALPVALAGFATYKFLIHQNR